MRTLRLDARLFPAMALANMLPVIRFTHLPAADGPSHVYNASLVSRYFFQPGDPIRTVLEWNTSFPPNVLVHGVLALLMTVLSPGLAERVFVALYVGSLPFALRYAMRAIAPRTYGVEFLGLALVFNSHLHWGFYNFLAGLVLFLVALGYWLRIRARDGSWKQLSAMSGLMILVYLSHPVPLINLWITIGALWGIAGIRERRWKLAELKRAALVSIPAACLCLHYAMTRASGETVPTVWPTLRYPASVLVQLTPLATYTSAERLAALGLSIIVAAAVVWAWTIGGRRPEHDCFYAAVMLAGLVFVAPTQAEGGTLITPRLVYFPLFLVLMWLASVNWPESLAAGFAIAGIGLALVGQVTRWPVYEGYNHRLNAFLELSAIREKGMVTVFHSAGRPPTVLLDALGTPYLPDSVWGYVAASRRGILLSDYEAALGYFPFRFRQGMDPSPYAIEPPPGCQMPGKLIDEERYRARTGLRVDAQLMWVEDEQPALEECVRLYDRKIVLVQHAAGGRLFWFDGGQVTRQ